MFSDIIGLADGLDTKESAFYLKGGVRDGTCWVVGGHKAVLDMFWSLVTPHYWLMMITFTGNELVSRDPYSTITNFLRIVVPQG